MRYSSYERYKDCGDTWLGRVPSHWAVLPLKASYSILGGATPKSDNSEYWDGEIPWITPGDLSISKSVYVRDTARSISDAGLASCAANLVPIDSVILSTRAPIGSLGISTVPTAFNQGCKALVSRERGPPRYLAYFLECAKTALNVRGKGTTFLELSGDELGRFKMPSPPRPEQAGIAEFLDRETARIDALVEAQERLIELLKEKRQAVISHAVTKGLDPTAPMKDSGVEWLGQIPAHWNMHPLKRDLLFLTSGSRGWAERYADEGAIFIRIGNLTRDSFSLDLSDTQRVSVPDNLEADRTSVRPGDLLFSITAYLGSVAVAPDLGEPAYVSQHVALARIKTERLLPEWVALVTLSIVGQTYLAERAYGGTKVQLSLDDVGGLLLTIPPLTEQVSILEFVESKNSALRTLQAQAEAAISLLQERRAALISAAVTGKIDVRGLVQTVAAA